MFECAAQTNKQNCKREEIRVYVRESVLSVKCKEGANENDMTPC